MCWEEWAKKVIDGSSSLGQIEMGILNTLLPDHDFPIWRLGKKSLTLKELIAHSNSFDCLYYSRHISYEMGDAVSYHDFNRYFKPNDNLIIVPALYTSNNDAFPLSIGACTISYYIRLLHALDSDWCYTGKTESRIVGEVNSIGVYRNVQVLRRRK